MDVLKLSKALEPYMIDVRRTLHQNPELSCQEFETQAFIIKELETIGIPYQKLGTTSTIATIKGGQPGKCVALRADIDALPIIEQSGVPYASKKHGVMHACGHDGHTAMLLAAAKMLNDMKDDLKGEVKLFFQEGEETFEGAKKIIADDGMAGIDAIFGMHGMPIDVGFYDIHAGYKMAGCDTIYVTFEGVSGHGSQPHLAKDTIHPACVFVTELQRIVTKMVNPLEPIVLSVGKFQGGTKANIVANLTKIDISMRYFDNAVRDTVHDAIKKHAEAIALAYGIAVDVDIEDSACSLYNDEEISTVAQNAAIKIFGEGKNIEMPRLMGSEDMAIYFKHAKGAYALLGYVNVEKDTIYFPHHDKFNIDEDYLKYGAALHVQFALDFLNG